MFLILCSNYDKTYKYFEKRVYVFSLSLIIGVFCVNLSSTSYAETLKDVSKFHAFADIKPAEGYTKAENIFVDEEYADVKQFHLIGVIEYSFGNEALFSVNNKLFAVVKGAELFGYIVLEIYMERVILGKDGNNFEISLLGR